MAEPRSQAGWPLAPPNFRRVDGTQFAASAWKFQKNWRQAVTQLEEELQAANSRGKLGPFSLMPGPALGAWHCGAWANPPAARNERFPAAVSIEGRRERAARSRHDVTRRG
jgi:hypothetical protein